MTTVSVPPQHGKLPNSTIRAVASILGAIVGLAGIEHGIFEILQDNIATNALVIEAIGPAQKLWSGATEPALTIIPTFFASGVFAIAIGFLMIIWSVAFIQKKHGALILLFLSILLFLVGGGSPPIFLGIIASIVATRINKPLTWWQTHLSVGTRHFLGKCWIWLMITFIIMFWFAVLAAITGYPLVLFLDPTSTDFLPILSALGYISDIVLILAVFAGFARDTLEN